MTLPRVLAATSILAAALGAQNPPELRQATAKPSARTSLGGFSLAPLAAEGATLEDLIRFAYHVRDFEIAGGPAWINSDRYDVTAKPLAGPPREFFDKPLPPLQDLLREKFHLQLHRETREIPIFTLTASKYGAELHRSKVTSCAAFKWGRYSPPPGERPEDCSGVETGPNLQLNETLDAVGMPVSGSAGFNLVQLLSRELDRVVIDKTGLPGLFDIVLEWNRQATKERLKSAATEDPDSPSLFEAVQQQLGLKLEPAKGPVEILVIDHAEKPTG